MSSQSGSPSENPYAGTLSCHLELEWLLCLASTFQRCNAERLRTMCSELHELDLYTREPGSAYVGLDGAVRRG
jgi:hypothetical protein